MVAGDNNKALEVLKRAHQGQKSNIDLHIEWIRGLVTAKRFDEAEKEINGLIADDLNSAQLTYTQAEVMQAKGLKKLAIELYQKTLGQDPSFELALARLFALLGNGVNVSEFELLDKKINNQSKNQRIGCKQLSKRNTFPI